MAAIQNTSKASLAPVTPAQVTLATSGDTLTYLANQGQELILVNTSASSVNVTIDGADGSTITVPGTGGTTLSVAGGYVVAVAANATTVVRLDNIAEYLKGVVAITAATGAVIKAAIVY